MPLYKSPIRPYDPVIQIPGTSNFHYIRDNFYGAGQDSYTQPFAQNQELFARLQNIMPVSQGVCVLRYGYKLFNNPTGTINRIYSYQNITSSVRKLVYCAGTSVKQSAEDGTGLASILTSTNSTSIRGVNSRDYFYFPSTTVAVSPLVGNAYNATASAQNSKSDGQKWHSANGLSAWGIYPAGTDSVALNSSAAGNVTLTSGRTWLAVYHNSTTGHYSDLAQAVGTVSSVNPPLPETNSGAQTSKQFTLGVSYSPDPQIDKIAILATLDGGDQTTLYFLGEVTNLPASYPGTTTFVDNVPDTSLVLNNIFLETDEFGLQHGVADNTPPPVGLKFPTKYRGRIWGSVGETLYFSKNLDELTTSTGTVCGRYEESWPATNTMDVSTQREEIRGLLTDGDVLYVGTERHIWRVSGDSPSNFSKPEIIFNEVGILNQDVWQIVFAEGRPLGMIWLTPDRRVIMSNFGNYEDIGTPIQDVLNTLNISAAGTAWGSFYSEGAYDLFILAIPTGVNTSPDTFCVFDLRGQRWYVWLPTDNFTCGMFNIDANGNPQWLAGASTGKVYQFTSTATQDRVNDVPVSILPSIQTPWMHLGSPTMVKAINEVEVITGDTGMTLTIDGASRFAETSAPNNVVTSAALVSSPRGFLKAYTADKTSKDRFYRLTFNGTGSSTNVLEGFTIEAVLIPY